MSHQLSLVSSVPDAGAIGDLIVAAAEQRPDLKHKAWKDHPHPLGGMCLYVSQVFAHYTGAEIWRMETHEGLHWYNRLDGEVLDLTAGQFFGAKLEYGGKRVSRQKYKNARALLEDVERMRS